MAMDKQGKLFTDKEYINKKIDELILKLEKTDRCKQAYSKLENHYKLVRELLQEKDRRLVTDIDDCFIEILILFEEYFYAHGYSDGCKDE